MAAETEDHFLLALLNTTPVVDGADTDDLADLDAARSWLLSVGGLGTETELAHLRRARTALQGIVRGQLAASTLEPLLRGLRLVPVIADGIVWDLSIDPERGLATRAVLAWDAVTRQSSGRLRPCANGECRLFLIDRSSANRARWCSMAVCGNRMKARRHYQRGRGAASESYP